MEKSIWINLPPSSSLFSTEWTVTVLGVSQFPGVKVTVTSPVPEVLVEVPEKPITEMTVQELESKITEIQQKIIDILGQIIQLFQQQIQALLAK